MGDWKGNILGKIYSIHFTNKLNDCQNFLLKKLEKIGQIFRPLFRPLLAKIGGRIRPQKFFDQRIFVRAPFELFCRIFGHLATEGILVYYCTTD